MNPLLDKDWTTILSSPPGIGSLEIAGLIFFETGTKVMEYNKRGTLLVALGLFFAALGIVELAVALNNKFGWL